MKNVSRPLLLCGFLVTGALWAEEPEAPTIPPLSVQVEALAAEIAGLKRELRGAETESLESGGSSDAAVAARAVRQETIFARQRALSALRRQQLAEDGAARAERQALQAELAAAPTPEERQALLERHIALKQALAIEKNAETPASEP